MNKHELTYTLITSVLLALSFPPFPLGFLVPVAVALYLHFMESKTPGESFRLGYWLGLIWGAFTIYWIAGSTLIGAILVILINALHYAIVWWLYSHFKKAGKGFALVALPFLWTGMEYLRHFTDIRFNWMNLAYTQTYYLPFIQIIEITGYLFLSFLLVSFGILFYLFFRERQYWRWVTPVVIVIMISGMILYGNGRIEQIENREYNLIRAGISQPNVDPFQKWEDWFQEQAFEMLMDANQYLAALKPDLIVWPETATPFYLRAREEALRRIHSFVDSTNIYLLTGSPDYRYISESEDYHTYNAALFFRPGSAGLETYYKMALVPGSETIPFKKYLSFFRELNMGVGDFFPGTEFTVFRFQIPARWGRYENKTYPVTRTDSGKTVQVSLSAIICYESVFPQIVRKFIKNGADVITIITNDGWFGNSSGPYQHARYAVLRAVENRVSIIRCANTGVSEFIDPVGRVIKTAALNTRKDMVANLPINRNSTYYTQNGDWIGKITVLMSFLFIFFKLLSSVIFGRRKVEMKN